MTHAHEQVHETVDLVVVGSGAAVMAAGCGSPETLCSHVRRRRTTSRMREPT